ncbi:MAG: hypothetical protein QXP38_07630 [Nitrososphaerota archaeon]
MTLVTPSLKDDEECLSGIARMIRKALVEDTPWHLIQYYPAYRALEYGLYNGSAPIWDFGTGVESGKRGTKLCLYGERPRTPIREHVLPQVRLPID